MSVDGRGEPKTKLVTLVGEGQSCYVKKTKKLA